MMFGVFHKCYNALNNCANSSLSRSMLSIKPQTRNKHRQCTRCLLHENQHPRRPFQMIMLNHPSSPSLCYLVQMHFRPSMNMSNRAKSLPFWQAWALSIIISPSSPTILSSSAYLDQSTNKIQRQTITQNCFNEYPQSEDVNPYHDSFAPPSSGQS